jgi:hypothetical protein
MKKIYLFLIVIIVLALIAGVGLWFFLIMDVKTATISEDKEVKKEEIQKTGFVPLQTAKTPPFIQGIKNATGVTVGFHYEGDYNPANTFTGETPTFYVPPGSTEKFLSLSKVKNRQEEFSFGPYDYLSIFKSEESHSYQGTPIAITNNTYDKFSLAYIGFNINDKTLISDMKVELGIDFNADYWDQYNQTGAYNNKSLLASLLGAETVSACGPGIYLRKVGESQLNLTQEADGVAWYRLEKPIAIHDLRLSFCDNDCNAIPNQCHFWADDPAFCEPYWCCQFNATIKDLSKGNLRMHIYYKANDKEGLLRLQVANLILSDISGRFYQATMGQDFNHYYRAYLH